jgi:hypothetical protein
MTAKENIMGNKNKMVEPLPDSFATAEEAGEFWDTHSTADYLEYLEASDDIIEINKRVFEVQIAEDIFQKLQQEADLSNQSVPKVVDQILRKKLTLV